MLTIERLKEVLDFNEAEGRFYWKVKNRKILVGQQAGSFDAYGYGQVTVDGLLYKEHRLVWFYVTGSWPVDQIDHINHDRRDNVFSNLRETNNMENHNNRPMQANNTSGFVGVHFCKRAQLFQAYAHYQGKRQYLGWYKNFDDAVAARKAANIKFGFHENHGKGQGIPKKPPMSNKKGRPAQATKATA